MTILIRSKTECGERRCDAKCYNAKSETCTCICEGVNHGVGLEQARDNLHELVQEGFGDEVDWFEPHTIRMFPNANLTSKSF